MHTVLYTLVKIEQRQPFADAAGWHTHGAGNAGEGGASLDEAVVCSPLFEWRQL
jgi:hypothetical protein